MILGHLKMFDIRHALYLIRSIEDRQDALLDRADEIYGLGINSSTSEDDDDELDP